MKSNTAINKITKILTELDSLELQEKIELFNKIKTVVHEHSPFKDEPVDCILWEPNTLVQANDYNPNTVAPPEMKLLEHSIREDHFTQPIVAWNTEDIFEVVDGFHRHRVGKECQDINQRMYGYLPLAIINNSRIDRGDRIAATIRHNRARGKHQVTGMSDIVLELHRRNWSDSKIGKELGMEPDEVLRLAQITGLAEMFKDREFSEAWEAESSNTINAYDNLEVLEENIECNESIIPTGNGKMQKPECGEMLMEKNGSNYSMKL